MEVVHLYLFLLSYRIDRPHLLLLDDPLHGLLLPSNEALLFFRELHELRDVELQADVLHDVLLLRGLLESDLLR